LKGVVRGYSLLAIGLLGSVLVLITCIATIADWPRFMTLVWASQLLFVIAAISGIGQWVTFYRRRFHLTVVLFVVTLASWCAAASVHALHPLPACQGDPCVVILRAVPA
jgi:hypothetical protein